MQVASVFSTHVNVSVLCVCARARTRAFVRACVRASAGGCTVLYVYWNVLQAATCVAMLGGMRR